MINFLQMNSQISVLVLITGSMRRNRELKITHEQRKNTHDVTHLAAAGRRRSKRVITIDRAITITLLADLNEPNLYLQTTSISSGIVCALLLTSFFES